MPVLSNPKHEALALGLAKGITTDAAYKQAGYKRNSGNAARLAANAEIKDRVAELVKEITAKGVTFATINFREQMHKMIKIVDLAIEAKDLNVAKDAQKFILTCGGYADSPTLTHEHMGERPLETKESVAAEQDRDNTNVLRFSKVRMMIDEFRKQRRPEDGGGK